MNGALQDDFVMRTRMLVGEESLERLRDAHVLVVGLGGVGGYAAELLCRAGVGRLTLVDGDTVSESNINRQIIALRSTIGESKANLFKERFGDINPDCRVTAINEYLRDERMVDLLEADAYSCVVDCIDTLSPKVFLLYNSVQRQLPIVSAMGSGGKMDPSQVQVADLSKSHSCPLAAMVRRRLHRLGVTEGIRVVFSPEKVPGHAMKEELSENKRTVLGTISYMPPLFGCYMASEVIRLILN